jgi:hypothetical protein
MLQAERPDEVNDFCNSPNSLGDIRPWGLFTQSVTEMSTKNRKLMILGSRARPVRRANSLTAIFEPVVYTVWDP